MVFLKGHKENLVSLQKYYFCFEENWYPFLFILFHPFSSKKAEKGREGIPG